MAIAANKVHGVRAAVVHDVTSARLAREHDDANVICIGARLVGPLLATEALDAFMHSRFEGGRHLRRVEKVTALEQSQA
jgi:ribose 5-phosphate isomerase B